MISLAVSNLKRRKVRSAICILAVALGITLLLVLVGLCNGVISESSRRVTRIGADIIVQPTGSSYFLGLRSGNLPVAYGEKLEDPGDIEAALKRGLEETGRGKAALLDVILAPLP